MSGKINWKIYDVLLRKDFADSDAAAARLSYSRVRVVKRYVSALGDSRAVHVVVFDPASIKVVK